MKNHIFYLILLFFILSCAEKKPNILLINIDDMGWRDVGFMGSEFYETPHIDKLASEGMVFMQGYSSAANCAPSRASMMSGMYTPRHGIFTVGNSDRGASRDRRLVPTVNTVTIHDTIITLTHVLKANGYRTCHAGKWHLSNDPLEYGFDVNIGGSHAGHPRSYYSPYKNVDLEAPDGEYLTDLIMEKTLEFVEKESDQPFFLNYSPYAVHTPIHRIDSLMYKFEDKEPWKGQQNAAYATMVNNLDRNIGNLINSLKKNGLYENTFIVFTSDNGGLYRITRQKPLRAGKGSYYEGGIRVPLFFVWEGKIAPGTTNNETPVINIDFYPTLLEVAGIDPPEDKLLDGMNILPVLRNEKQFPERTLFWHFPIYLQNGNKETRDTLFRTRPGTVIRHGKWKLHQYFEDGDMELYNLDTDIGEQNNLAGSNPDKVQELLEILIEWQGKTQAPVPEQRNLDYEPRLSADE